MNRTRNSVIYLLFSLCQMSVMIFKRAVYESRRKPKSYFRPKLRVSLKEAQNVSLTFCIILLCLLFACDEYVI